MSDMPRLMATAIEISPLPVGDGLMIAAYASAGGLSLREMIRVSDREIALSANVRGIALRVGDLCADHWICLADGMLDNIEAAIIQRRQFIAGGRDE